MEKLEPKLNENGEWVLDGATEALKENIRKYPTYEDLRKAHDEYWGLSKKINEIL